MKFTCRMGPSPFSAEPIRPANSSFPDQEPFPFRISALQSEISINYPALSDGGFTTSVEPACQAWHGLASRLMLPTKSSIIRTGPSLALRPSISATIFSQNEKSHWKCGAHMSSEPLQKPPSKTTICRRWREPGPSALCPLLGVKRTWVEHRGMSGNDPKRTSGRSVPVSTQTHVRNLVTRETFRGLGDLCNVFGLERHGK